MLHGKLLTAITLDDQTLLETEQRFAKLLGEEVTLVQQVDKNLLGGVRVEIGGRVYDDSIRGQLASLAVNMYKETHDALEGTDVPADAQARVRALLEKQLDGVAHAPKTRAFGKVLRTGDGIATASGLSGCQSGVLLRLDESASGTALNLNVDSVDVVILAGDETVHVGT